MKHLLTLLDYTSAEIVGLLDLASELKANPAAYQRSCRGKTLAMLFEKSSTRTRVSFEVGMLQLGGHAVFLASADSQIGRGESVADTAAVLSRYVDLIMARLYSHADLVALARHASVPVINALTDELHPCQALADILTLKEEFGALRGRKIAYVGDGNNVATSLMIAAAKTGVDIALASPRGFSVADSYLRAARRCAEETGSTIAVGHEPENAVAGASAIYTDVWTSMGYEGERAQRIKAFKGFQVNESLFETAREEAIFLHCLPCHRGEEVSAAVVDGPRSRVFDLAENRMHVQKAVMLTLLGRALGSEKEAAS